LTNFEKQQKQKLLNLRDSLMDAMIGVTKDNIRSHPDGGDASAFGMHQADAGSDAYDRDFALNLLSQEQDALHEIEQALERMNYLTYGICEISGKRIPHPRLEAIPFARYTVECQARIEREGGGRGGRRPAAQPFVGFMDERSGVESASDND
jgi:DnaK suppressor protein